MDTKSMHCKHPKKMKTSNDAVYVLPPELLQKLGVTKENNGRLVFPGVVNSFPSKLVLIFPF